jgi:hypothetical protein
MKRVLFIVIVLIGLGVVADSRFAGAESLWQYGRIDSIKKSVTSTTKAWVVNTPLDEEHTQYTILVHVQDRIIVGNYELSASQPEPPPPEWTSGSAVKLEVSGDSLYLRSATGSLRLHITQRKTAGPMQAVTAEEKKRLSELDAPPQSMIGFSKGEGSKAAPEPAPPPPPPPPAPLTGTVTVRSTPYLSEVFVDGDSMGYTPAKIALGPGKHSFRVEKPGFRAWTKEMTITVGSELTLDATLGRK